jgi:photosystem II stability/assembly factor-like uncharacterized protein
MPQGFADPRTAVHTAADARTAGAASARARIAMFVRVVPLFCAAALLCVLPPARAQSGQILAPTEGPIAGIQETPASRLAQPESTMILGATRTGKRLIGVGDRGLVLLSDDEGVSWRQAAAVPTRATLCAVNFVDEKNGWAVGHWGVILVTHDGGENWALQRDDRTVDQPLFSVWFKDTRAGVAVGLFSLLLTTRDGGLTWEKGQLPTPAGAHRVDTNLFALFADAHGLLVAGEQGMVYRSEDLGHVWKPLPTGNKGTLWAGVALRDGTLVVAGLRGKVLRSTDLGHSWTAVASGTESSITSLTELPGGRLCATALDGVSLTSDDGGRTFTLLQRVEPLALTTVAPRADGIPLYFSTAGVVRAQ